MRDLREEVVDNMGTDVVVDLVDPAVVPVHRRQPAAQVAPLLAAVPGEALLVAMVVQVRHQVKPHHKHLQYYMHAVRPGCICHQSFNFGTGLSCLLADDSTINASTR